MYLATFTMRRRHGPGLGELLDKQASAWGSMVRSRWWQVTGRIVGLVGHVRATEVVWSTATGWGPHLHVLVWTERPLPVEAMAGWWMALRDRWADHVGRVDESLRPASDRFGVGVDLRQIAVESAETACGYLIKDQLAGAAREVTHPEGKKGRGESVGPFQLGEAGARGDRQALGLWHEYEAATRGRHRLRWSRGMRERLGLGKEHTDEQILEENEVDETVTELTSDETALVLYAPEMGVLACEAAEAGGADRVHAVLGAAWAALSWSEQVAVRAWAKDRTGMANRRKRRRR